MKKIINAPEAVIEDYITGLVTASPHLARLHDLPVVVRAPHARKREDRVALVSGGGSGHEPAHAGYVGEGMLDAAVLGPVFTSPSVDAVYAAIVASATDAGVLLIVKNYTGDRLNFGLAADMARAAGIRVEMVVVADDAALGDSSRAGRRGLTATILVHKIAGAAAERGWTMERIVEIVDRFLAGAATMGVALGPCFVPGADAPNFDLGDDEIEWGLGIHGEAGSERGVLVPARDIAARLVDTVVADRGLRAGADIVVLVNSLGGTPDLDLRILHGEVLDALGARGLRVRMTWAGPFLTSLEMPGASLTLASVDDEMLTLLAEGALVAAFPRSDARFDAARVLSIPAPALSRPDTGTGSSSDVASTHRIVQFIAQALVASEPELTDLDRRVGDGDLGVNLSRGAAAVIAASERLLGCPDVARYLAAVSEIIRRDVGGTSGPLYSLLLLAMSEHLSTVAGAPTVGRWSEAFAAGVARIRDIGGAAPGDSTMVDALQPAAEDLVSSPADSAHERARSAARAARAGASSTAALRANLGRSSYVGARSVGVPDPGAVAVAIQFEALADALGRDRETSTS